MVQAVLDLMAHARADRTDLRERELRHELGTGASGADDPDALASAKRTVRGIGGASTGSPVAVARPSPAGSVSTATAPARTASAAKLSPSLRMPVDSNRNSG